MSTIEDILRDPRQFRILVEAAFKSVDIDGSGYLERDELEKVMGSISVDLGCDV